MVLTADQMKGLITQLENYHMSSIECGAAVISFFAWLNSVAVYHGKICFPSFFVLLMHKTPQMSYSQTLV